MPMGYLRGYGQPPSDGSLSRIDWWFGILVIAVVLLTHIACPRYEYIVLGPNQSDVLRHDRWTGDSEHMGLIDRGDSRGTTEPLPLPFQ